MTSIAEKKHSFTRKAQTHTTQHKHTHTLTQNEKFYENVYETKYKMSKAQCG